MNTLLGIFVAVVSAFLLFAIWDGTRELFSDD